MEHQRHLAVKPLKAVGRNSVNNQKPALRQLEGAQQQALRSKKRPKPKTQIQRFGTVQEVLKTHLGPCPAFPPEFDSTPSRFIRRRWQSAENVAISTQGFALGFGHQQFLVVTVLGANDTGVSYADCWRLRKIEVWCRDSDENSTTVSIQPNAIDIDTNCFNDREANFVCSSKGTSKPGFMSIVCAPDTPLGSWHRCSTVNQNGILFYMDVDYGGASSGNWASVTLDLCFEYVENTIGVPQGYTKSTLTTGHTLGTMGGCNLFSSALLLQGCNVLA